MVIAYNALPPTSVLTVAEAKSHLRLDDDELDPEVLAYCQAATQYLEDITGRRFLEAEYTLELAGFPVYPCPILLPKPPLATLVSVDYVDPNGDPQTLAEGADFVVVQPAENPAYLDPVEAWPETRDRPFPAVTVVYRAGYGDKPSDVPEAIRQAARLVLGSYWCNRTNAPHAGNLVPAADALIATFRVKDARLEGFA